MRYIYRDGEPICTGYSLGKLPEIDPNIIRNSRECLAKIDPWITVARLPVEHE